jgi:hypothetical protein
MDNHNLDTVFNKWMRDYNVPEQYRDFWRNSIVIEVTDSVDVASSWDDNGIRHLAVNPKFLNPGVIAHEQAHNSYALLTDEQKEEFSVTYTPLKTTDPLIVYLYSINNYGLQNNVEGHAEVFRFIDEMMPEELKKYYPRLF